MLLELHTILQRLLYERGQISPQEVEIRFEAPTQERIDRLLLPTISLFLFEVQENTELRQNSYATVRENGRAERRQAPKRFDLHFLISALSSEIEDEHLLLWRVLSTLVRYPQLPRDLLPETVRHLEIPLSTKLCQGEESQRLLGVWNALGVSPRPALAYTITVPVDLAHTIEAPLVLKRVTRYTRAASTEQSSETRRQIGGVVRDKNGATLAGVRVALDGQARESVTTADGRFVLRDVPTGPLTLRVMPVSGPPHILTIANPASQSDQVAGEDAPSYDIVL